MSLGIYRRPGRYIVKTLSDAEPGLWAQLGPAYTRDTAQALADKLTEELRGDETMSMTLDGKGWSLNAIMREKRYETMREEELQELLVQLQEAAVKASRSGRRLRYAAWATLVKGKLADSLEVQS